MLNKYSFPLIERNECTNKIVGFFISPIHYLIMSSGSNWISRAMTSGKHWDVAACDATGNQKAKSSEARNSTHLDQVRFKVTSV